MLGYLCLWRYVMARYTKMRKVSDTEIELIKKKVSYQEYFDKKIVPNLEDYYKREPVDFVLHNNKCLCPFHNDGTSSFSIKEWPSGDVTFACFACGYVGNIANLHMLYAKFFEDRKLNFFEAAAEVYAEFIEGRNISQAVSGTKIRLKSDRPAELNSVSDLTTFSISLSKYEGFLHKVRDSEQKDAYYALMDKLEYLVVNNQVPARLATGLLDDRYKQLVI